MSIFTGDAISEDRTVSCDVCVIGSGAGGAVTAQRLSAAGKRVVILEDGGFHTSDTFTLREKDMYPRLYQEAGARGTSDKSIGILQGRAVGGTTVANWTTCFRTPEHVLAHWAEAHGASAIQKELGEHFARIEERINVTPMLLEQVNRNNRILWDGAKALGYDVELLRRNVKRCMHTGYCGLGCPIDAKQSMLTTFIPDAMKLGADLYANAHVVALESDGRRVTRAVAQMRDPRTDALSGKTLTVEAKQFVLSGGAINSPALLLRSGITSNGRVGKRTYLHPTMLIAGIHEQPVDGFKGSPQYVGCGEFSRREEDKMGYLLEQAPIFPASTAQGFTFGHALQSWMDQIRYISVTLGLLQDGFDVADPDEGGTVTLTERGTPKVDYKWNPRMMEALQHSAIESARIQFAAGAKRVHLIHKREVVLDSPDELHKLQKVSYGPGQVGVFSAHVMGGCTMGTDPATSVVDASNLRLHERDNLFVIDGSVFPTASTVNPQLSIYTLASWASEHVKAAS